MGRGAWMAGTWAHLGWVEEALEFWREPKGEWGAVWQCASWMPVYEPCWENNCREAKECGEFHGLMVPVRGWWLPALPGVTSHAAHATSCAWDSHQDLGWDSGLSTAQFQM